MNKQSILCFIAFFALVDVNAIAQSSATGQILGHDYVDLGLSVMWATCNIGASSPSDYGDYFAWGEAETKSRYEMSNSATFGQNIIKYQDAVREKWGSQWRLSTSAEYKELVDNCEQIFTNIGGQEGILFKSKKNGNSIFMPAAGFREGMSLYDKAQKGYYWTSSQDEKSDYLSYAFYFFDYANAMPIDRYVGFPIRPVADNTIAQEKQKQINCTVNGHECVDLGLSVKWATCNIGADSPEEFGDYFAWGEVKTKASYNSKKSETYGKSEYVFRDAATYNWGNLWRMPTKDECQELVDNCSWQWVTINGCYGCKITSNKNGNSLFFPAAGCRQWKELENVSQWGQYWSSSPCGNDSLRAKCIFFGSNRLREVAGFPRDIGFTIRPVTE